MQQLAPIIGFTLYRSALYTFIVNIPGLRDKLAPFLQYALVVFLVFPLCSKFAHAQDPAQKPAEKATGKKEEKTTPPEKVENPAQIELLETKIRIETNGDSRREVHTRVHINSELGVRQFARLNFDYNRSFQSIEIPSVHITHPSGGTADILPSAISDNPNAAVLNAPAYQDVRVKSVRILGLEPGDNLEYRVITTTTHHPLAPDFWLDHSFDRTGVVSQEIFELDLPSSRKVQLRINPATTATSSDKSASDDAKRVIYKWDLNSSNLRESKPNQSGPDEGPDIAITTFSSWSQLGARLLQRVNTFFGTTLWVEAMERIGAPREPVPTRQLYDFVSKKIVTVDLPLDFGLPFWGAEEIFSSNYGRPDDKVKLLLILNEQNSPKLASLCLYSSFKSPETQLPRPSLFSGMLLVLQESAKTVYLDPSLEVAPFGMIRPDVRGKKALILGSCPTDDASCWTTISGDLPFPSIQRVNVDAALNADGNLTAKVHYSMRGDNELVLRLAFHKTPKEKWKELAQLLSITDGFRGQVTSIDTSDPYATREPFTLDYEITMPKFVDWSKKPVRIPALLPQLGLPDPPARPVAGAATSPIELGTPLEVEIRMTLHLPAGTAVQAPTGTSVQRDYATFASQYSTRGSSVMASRHINFLLREIPGNRAVDYNSFLRAVQSDEAQDFTLVREEGTTPEKKPVAPQSPTPTQAATAQPKL